MSHVADTGEYTSKRGDYSVVDPRGLVVDWRKNIPRAGVEPAVDEALIKLARSMLPKTAGGRGQLHPIRVRPLHDRRLEVFAGFRRMRAALWLIESGECPDFQIAYTVSKVTDQEAAIDNVVENLDRLEPKPIEMAHAIRTLQESYLLSVEEIAAKLNRTIAWVNGTADLVMLPEPIQEAVKAEELSATAAKEFIDLPAPEAVRTFNALRDSGERISATTVKDAKRAKREKAVASGSVAPADVAPVKRSLRHVREFLEPATGPGENHNGKLVAERLLEFVDGTSSGDQLQATWDRIFPAPVTRATAAKKKTKNLSATKAAIA